MEWHKIEKHVSKVIVFDRDGKLIVCLRDNNPAIPFPNTWGLLGGGVEESETPEQAAIRELSEEVGITVNQVNKVSEYVLHNSFFNNTEIFHFFYTTIESPVSALVLTEGQRLEGIHLSEKDKYLTGMLARAVYDYMAKDGK